MQQVATLRHTTHLGIVPMFASVGTSVALAVDDPSDRQQRTSTATMCPLRQQLVSSAVERSLSLIKPTLISTRFTDKPYRATDNFFWTWCAPGCWIMGNRVKWVLLYRCQCFERDVINV